jgi:dihydroorotase-like cyclic amidohydrolase
MNDPHQVEIVDKLRQEHDLPVTMGVTPHHLFMDSHYVHTMGSFARMQPPLASQTDSERLWWQTFKEDKIDLIETDHAPHMLGDKWKAEEENPKGNPDGPVCYGVPGSRYAIPQLLNQERRGRVTLEQIVQKTSEAPAKLLGIKIRPDSRVVWSKRLYRIGEEPAWDGKEAIVEGYRKTPYLGNFAVGQVREFTLGGKKLITDGAMTKEKLKSVTLKSGMQI